MNKYDAERLANKLMAEHLPFSVTAYPRWRLEFDNAKRRLGVCRFASRTISLSLPLILLNDEASVRDTILHEIAHALAGPEAKHGIMWKAQCYKIGAKPNRCVEQDAIERVPARYSAPCPNPDCGHIIQRHRLKRGESVTLACNICCRRYNRGKFSQKYAVTLTSTG